jgi:hypothetical protein
MSINYNVFQSGLNGGTKVLTGDKNIPTIEHGDFQGFVVVNSCFIDSILNQNNINVIDNVLLNDKVTNILNKNLVRGDVVKPVLTSDYFTEINMRSFSDKSQIIIYIKK